MKKLLVSLPLLFSFFSFAQTKKDTIDLLRKTALLYDLSFSDAEADSLIGGIQRLRRDLVNNHMVMPSNRLQFPFAFNPAPFGYKIPAETSGDVSAGKQKINWQIPNNIKLPENRNELAFYSITQLASLIKNKKITSVDLTRFFLDRLKKHNDTLVCVVSFTEELAMQQAAKADEEIRKGIYRGPLHGIPYGLKDLFAVKGYKTTWGSAPFKDQVIDENSFVFEQLSKAGAVLCAKLSLGALANNDVWFGGRTKNPWNTQQGSSGSSAGSASATAAGLLPFAIGSETWGSIISPSTRCGVTGLRPTFGAVSRSGAMVLSWSLDKAGPLCRSAEDCAIVFDAIKGTDGKDHSAINYAFNYGVKKDLKKLRVGYAANYFNRLPKDAAEWKVLEDFKAMGISPEAVSFPDSAIYPLELMNIILSSESAAAFDELTRSNRDEMIERQDKGFWPNIFRTARYIPAVEYINANRHRYTLIEKLNDFMKDYDLIITPTFSGNQLAMTNLSGHPAICLPIGFAKNGNPLSITFIGNLYDDATILQAAKAYQDRTVHNKKHPPAFLD
jgi:Asp-tRNA(Asn)/Glu-tRNA(Gln) amidotransferase A subunit family amidase